MEHQRNLLTSRVEMAESSSTNCDQEKKCLEDLLMMREEVLLELKEMGYGSIDPKISSVLHNLPLEDLGNNRQQHYQKKVEVAYESINITREQNKKKVTNDNMYSLIDGQMATEYENIYKLKILENRVQSILEFLGDRNTVNFEKGCFDIVDEVEYWHEQAKYLDNEGGKDVLHRINFLTMTLSTINVEDKDKLTEEVRLEAESILKNLTYPSRSLRKDIQSLSDKIERTSTTIEPLAKLSLTFTNLKERVEGCHSNLNETASTLEHLQSAIQNNKSVLEKNLASFEARIKNLGL